MPNDNKQLFNSTMPTVLLFFVCALVSCFIFRDFILQKLIFVGDSDRLNTFLNIRKFQVDHLQLSGHVPSWNEHMFMGYSLSGIHWMLTGYDVFAWFQSLFDIKHLYIVTTYTTAFLHLLTVLFAFTYIKYVVKDEFASLICAILYACSSISLMRLSQLDNASLSIMLLPLGMLSIRKLFYMHSRLYLIFLLFLSVTILTSSFLQEAAYALLLFGMYTVYLAVATKNKKTFLQIALVFTCCLIISIPRLYTVLLELGTFERTQTLHVTNPQEILRWVYDGIFGRFPSELPSYYRYNIHEGLQIYTSPLAFFSIVLLWMVMLSNTKFDKVPVIGFSILMFIVGILSTYRFNGFVNEIFFSVILLFFVAMSLMWAISNSNSKYKISFFQTKDVREVWFYTSLLVLFLLMILHSTFRQFVYLMFLKIDFTHSRLSVIAILPCVLLNAYFLKSLPGNNAVLEHKLPILKNWNLLLLAVICSLGLTFVFDILWTDTFYIPHSSVKKHYIQATPLLYVGLMFLVMIAILFIIPKLKYNSKLRIFMTFLIGCLMASSAMQYSHLQLSGKQTRTLVPFSSNDLYTTNINKFNLPSKNEISRIRHLFDTENYRIGVVSAQKDFDAYSSAHLAQFWQLRMIEGYGAGVPKRLSRIHWPEGVNRLRALRFETWDHIPWEIFAMLNVKYVLPFNEDLYFNSSNLQENLNFEHLKVRVNPYQVVPRVFFAEKIAPLDYDIKAPRALTPPAVKLYNIDRNKVIICWPIENNYNYDDYNYFIEMKKTDASSFDQIAVIKTNVFVSDPLVPGAEYIFRVRANNRNGNFSQYSKNATITIPIDGTHELNDLPSSVKVVSLDKNNIHVAWDNFVEYVTYKISVYDTLGNLKYTKQSKGVSETILHLIDTPKGHLQIQTCFADKCTTLPHNYAFDTNNVIDKMYPNREIKISDGLSIHANPMHLSKVEGINYEREFDSYGTIEANFSNDIVSIKISPSSQERFLVLNEMYHHTWKAFANGKALNVYPVNLVMRGIIVPENVEFIEFKNISFMSTTISKFIILSGMLMFSVFIYLVFRSYSKQGD